MKEYRSSHCGRLIAVREKRPIKRAIPKTVLMSLHIAQPYYERVWFHFQDLEQLVFDSFRLLNVIIAIAVILNITTRTLGSGPKQFTVCTVNTNVLTKNIGYHEKVVITSLLAYDN